MEGVTEFRDYVVGSKLGNGSFGEVYLVRGKKDRKPYAAKLESRRTKEGKRRRGPSQLEFEFRIYQMLEGCRGTPKVHDFFTHRTPDGGSFNVLIMDRLGRSIQDVLEQRGGKLPTKTALAIGARVLRHLQIIHGEGLIHRDLKPQNLMLAEKAEKEVYLIDFGLAKRVIDADGVHIPYYEKGNGLTGTPRFASVSSHMGIEQSRRDDLESLIYIIIYLKKGRLPWQGTRGERKERYKKILKKKRTISDAKLAEGFPQPFQDFVKEIRSLRFKDEPPYNRLTEMLIDAHDEL